MLSAILSHFRQHNAYTYLCSFSFLPNTPVCPTGHANRKYHRAFKPTLFCTAQFLSSDHEDANPPFLITLAITMLLVDTNALYKWYLLSYPLTMLAHFLTPFLFFFKYLYSRWNIGYHFTPIHVSNFHCIFISSQLEHYEIDTWETGKNLTVTWIKIDYLETWNNNLILSCFHSLLCNAFN